MGSGDDSVLAIEVRQNLEVLASDLCIWVSIDQGLEVLPTNPGIGIGVNQGLEVFTTYALVCHDASDRTPISVPFTSLMVHSVLFDGFLA